MNKKNPRMTEKGKEKERKGERESMEHTAIGSLLKRQRNKKPHE